MKHTEFSFMDDDYEVQVETDFDITEIQGQVKTILLNQISEQLPTTLEAGEEEPEELLTYPVTRSIASEVYIKPMG